MSVSWSSIDPRTGQKVQYGPQETAQLETAYRNGERYVNLDVSYLASALSAWSLCVQKITV